jgi:uncharacterized protein involved in exopolysaccharide biosynthesis
MIANRELGMDDYLAIGRRRIVLVLVPVLIAPLVGFLISYALTPKYTSRSLLLVEGQVVPSGYVKPIVTERVSARMITLQQNALSRNRLQPMVARLGLARNGKSVDSVIDDIRQNVSVTETDLSSPPGAKASSTGLKRGGPGGTADVPAFYVSYTTDNPRDAQQVCGEITSMLLEENLELRKQVAQNTTDFLVRQLEQAKHDLDEQDTKLADFKRQHLGRLPGDVDSNLKILMGLESQLDANTQVINRTQQDKAYAEMQINQELTAWKASLAEPNYPSLRQELIQLQNKLVTLQSLYTEDHPDVVKIEHEIAKLKARLKDMNAEVSSKVLNTDANAPATAGTTTEAQPVDGASAPATTAAASAASEDRPIRLEPPDVMRLRDQVHRNDMAIERATVQQKRLQERIDLYQDRLNVSPEIEEEYKQLTRDNATAHELYNNLLANKNNAVIQTEMERNQEGEQLKLLDPASLPGAPSYPVRWMFAAYGAAAGLCIGVCFAAWLELRDKSIRDEGDVLAALELPMLVSLPWSREEEPETKRPGLLRSPMTLFLEERKNA